MSKPLVDLPYPTLGALLGALSPKEFFNEWWEERPGVWSAGAPAERQSFRREDWRELALAARALNDGTVEILKGGPGSKRPSAERIDEGFGAGASVRVFKVQRVWPYLAQVCKDLQWELGFKVSANMYVTPEGRQGLDAHADSHDVLVVQMAGKKDWEIFGSPYALPVEYRAPMVFEEAQKRDHRGDEFGGRSYKDRDVGPPVLTCSLSPGDLLYIPRGFVHQAVASHDTSVHVTIGVHSTTWADILALGVAQESRMEPSLRETVPPGSHRVAAPREYVDGELRRRGAALIERIHGEALMLESASRFAASMSGAPPGEGAAEIDSEGGKKDPLPPAQPEPAFDTSRAYRLAHDAYVSFGGNAVTARSLRRPALVESFPLPLRAPFDRLIQGHSVSTSNLAPLTPRSAEVFLARLVSARILVPEAGS